MEYVTRAGLELPAVGLGTWQLDERTAYQTVVTALEMGYRHIDTAQAYGNEADVGRAIADTAVDRADVVITTKVHPSNRSVDSIVASVETSVDQLDVDRIDLLVIHWPHPLADTATVIDGLNAAVDRGLAEHIGVSNFGRERLDRARELSDAPIVTDQVLFHPWWPQRDLLRYCQESDVHLTAYSPLANGGALGDPVLADIGERYDKSPAQVAIRWAIQHDGVVAIPQSTSRPHLAENLDVFDFSLDATECGRITRPSYLKTGVALARGMVGI